MPKSTINPGMTPIPDAATKAVFSQLLLKWNSEENDRQMPWKGEKDPYKIWLSEIILQQTRVDQGLNYYKRFISTFPTVKDLAAAPDEQVMKLWEGLGYYSRCRNLIATARVISNELNGVFPDSFEEIKKLKGIGPYTASAISSFAFNLPHAVVDGNVFRVLARIFGIALPTDSTEGKKYFTVLADELLDKKHPGIYNQAIMDFGAVICKPALPLCNDCVFNKLCIAFNKDLIQYLPVKEKKTKIRNRWFYYIVLEYKDEIAIRQRNEKDIWQQLHEFPLIESPGELNKKTLIQQLSKKGWIFPLVEKGTELSILFKQQLSHQLIKGQFLKIKLSEKPNGGDDWIWVKKSKLHDYTFPQFIRQYIGIK